MASEPQAKAHQATRLLWARAGAYLLGFILPWSLISQLLGTAVTGRSWPTQPSGWWIAVVAFLATSLLAAVLSKNGQSPVDRLFRIQVVDTHNSPARRSRMLARYLAHCLDFPFALGFLWSIWDPHAHTFADKLVRTQVRNT